MCFGYSTLRLSPCHQTYVHVLPTADACPPAPEGFVLEAGRDAPGYNLGSNWAEERHPGNVPAIARRCAAQPECRSFNSDGWVKFAAEALEVDPNMCFYIKQSAWVRRGLCCSCALRCPRFPWPWTGV